MSIPQEYAEQARNLSDPEIEAIWAEEARARRQAYLEGRLEARDYEEIRKEWIQESIHEKELP